MTLFVQKVWWIILTQTLQFSQWPDFQPSSLSIWEEWCVPLLISSVLQRNSIFRDDFSKIECYLQQLITTSGFVVCPGICEYPASIRFNTKNLVVWSEPFNHCFSFKCSQWHVPNNVQQAPESAGFNCCNLCKQLIHDIRQLQHKSEKVTTPVRAHCLSASSKYPIS